MDHPTFQLRGSGHVFAPIGGPIDGNADALWFAELGRAFAEFARLEHMLTVLVVHINKEAASAELYERNPRDSFKALATILRAWLAKHDAYETLRSPIDDEFFDQLNRLADMRNDFAHGFIEAICPENGDFTICRVKCVGKDEWAIEAYQGPANTPLHAEMSGKATLCLIQIALEIFPREDPQPSPPQAAEGQL